MEPLLANALGEPALLALSDPFVATAGPALGTVILPLLGPTELGAEVALDGLLSLETGAHPLLLGSMALLGELLMVLSLAVLVALLGSVLWSAELGL